MNVAILLMIYFGKSIIDIPTIINLRGIRLRIKITRHSPHKPWIPIQIHTCHKIKCLTISSIWWRVLMSCRCFFIRISRNVQRWALSIKLRSASYLKFDNCIYTCIPLDLERNQAAISTVFFSGMLFTMHIWFITDKYLMESKKCNKYFKCTWI